MQPLGLLIVAALFASLTVAPAVVGGPDAPPPLTIESADAHQSDYCGHSNRGTWNRMYYRGSHLHTYKWSDDSGNIKITTEHHHKYEHKVLTPLGWLTDHWVRHKRCPKGAH